MGTKRQKGSRDGGEGVRHGPSRGSLLIAALMLCGLVALPGSQGLWATPQEEAAVSVETGTGWTDYDSQPLRVNVWHDKDEGDIYRRGESLQVNFETNQDAYAVVYRIDTDGYVTILWPRTRYDDGFIFGRHEYQLPAAGAPRIRTGSDEGVEYIEAVVSLYPFDLRSLEVDFHHEANDEGYAFRVAGDPFLAMNEVNYAVTGLEDPADYVVTNYASYYVHREVDHPRYLCSQCHDDDLGYDPYDDTCIVNIHHDYGWYNGWYLRFGYYPVYYYPCYYYVDPWTYRPWINYWYTPWYYWPYGWSYNWPSRYYLWYDSPYYWGDVWGRYSAGYRRYAPLSRDYRVRSHERDSVIRRRTSIVRDQRPSEDIVRAMRSRTRLDDRDALAVKGAKPTAGTDLRGKYRDVQPVERKRAKFRSPEPERASAGLRLDGGAVIRTGSSRDKTKNVGDSPLRVRDGSKTPGKEASGRSQEASKVLRSRSTKSDRASGKNQSGIRSVEPRKKGSRIWSGGRTSSSTDRKARPGQVKPRAKGSSQRPSAARPGSPQIKSKGSSSSSGSSRSKAVTPSKSGKSSGKDQSSSVRSTPRSKSGGSSRAVKSAPSRSSSSRSSATSGSSGSSRGSGRSSGSSKSGGRR